MPFYVRKSFKAGPIRLNLSKSGLGISAGVTGARIGINSRGRAYTHAGRYGLYHRQELSTSRGKARSEGPKPTQEHFADTGQTFASGTIYDPRRDQQASAGSWPHVPAHITLELVLPGALAIVSGAAWAYFGDGLTAGTGLILAGLLALLLGIRNILRNRRYRHLHSWMEAAATGDSDATARINRTLDAGTISRDIARAIATHVYRDFAVDALEDQVLESEESGRLAWLESTFRLDPDHVRRARVDALRQVFFTMVSDVDFDEGEDARLQILREQLGVGDDDLAEEDALAEKLRNLRRIRDGKLVPIGTQSKLQRDEGAFFEGEARLLKSRVLERFTRDGTKHVIRGFVTEKEGTLLITSKRVVLRHSGTTSIKHEDIIGLELDMDHNLLTIEKDGVATPTYISTREAPHAAALISHLAGV